VPFRVTAAALSSSSRRQADQASLTSHHSSGGLAKRERREVPLASQEGTKGVIQYALYVCLSLFPCPDPP